MQDRVSPFAVGARGHLEDYPALAVGVASAGSGTVQVAGLVEDDSGIGPAAIVEGVRKVVEDGFFPATVRAARQFEDRAVAQAAAFRCGSVDVAFLVEGQ